MSKNNPEPEEPFKILKDKVFKKREETESKPKKE